MIPKNPDRHKAELATLKVRLAELHTATRGERPPQVSIGAWASRHAAAHKVEKRIKYLMWVIARYYTDRDEVQS